MVQYFLDFCEYVRFSETLSEYQEQPYPIEKTTIMFLDPPKKAYNIRRILMEQSRNIPIFNIPQNVIEIFFRIYWKYLKEMFHEYSANIYLPGKYKSFMFDVWYGSISLQFLKNLKLNTLINAGYQYKLNSVT